MKRIYDSIVAGYKLTTENLYHMGFTLENIIQFVLNGELVFENGEYR